MQLSVNTKMEKVGFELVYAIYTLALLAVLQTSQLI